MEVLIPLLVTVIVFGGIVGAIVAVVRIFTRAARTIREEAVRSPDRGEECPVWAKEQEPGLEAVMPDGLSQVPREPDFPFEKKPQFLTRAERSFYGVLRTVADARGWDVFAKVRLEDLIEVRSGAESFQAHRNRIKSRHVDFLVCDGQTIAPLVAIELNDSSHRSGGQQERDAFVSGALGAAGVPLATVSARRAYSVAELAGIIDGKLGDGAASPAGVDADQATAVETVAGATATSLTRTCPRCGSALVERRSRKTGERFLGCSKYPGCLHTQPV